MTQFLPPNLLALFAPRDPLPFLPPPDKLPHEKKRLPYSGVGEYLRCFEDPKDTPPAVKGETREERQERKRKEKAELQAYKIEQGIAMWDPSSNAKATSDPFKTMFVGRINFDSSESKLRREFESYGPIRKVYLIYDKNNSKPRGYAFVEFEHERDMHAAYKHADGKKIDGRRVLVDVERGRTVKGWLPRRLGGGLGNTRKAKAPECETLSETKERSRDRSSSRRHDGGKDRRRSGSPRDRSSRRSRSRSRGGGGDRDRRRTERGGERERRERAVGGAAGADRDRERRPSRDRRAVGESSRRADKERGGDSSSRDDRRGEKERGEPSSRDDRRGEKERGGGGEPSSRDDRRGDKERGGGGGGSRDFRIKTEIKTENSFAESNYNNGNDQY